MASFLVNFKTEETTINSSHTEPIYLLDRDPIHACANGGEHQAGATSPITKFTIDGRLEGKKQEMLLN